MSNAYVGTPWWATKAMATKTIITRPLSLTFTATTTTVLNISPTSTRDPMPQFGDILLGFHGYEEFERLWKIQRFKECLYWPFIVHIYDLGNWIIAHGLLASLALIVFFPWGAISMRLLKGRPAFIFHYVLQAIGTILYLAAFAIGLKVTYVLNYDYDLKMSGGPRKPKTPCGENYWWSSSHVAFHTVIGAIVTACLMIQPFLGLLNHYFYKRKQRSTVWTHAHIWVGRAAITMGIINGGIGLWLAESDGRGERVKPVRPVSIVYAVFGLVVWAVWVWAAVRNEIVKKREQRIENATKRAHSESSNGTGGQQWIKMQTPERTHTSEEAVSSG